MSRTDIQQLAERVAADRAAIWERLSGTLPAAGALDRERLRAIALADRAELYRSHGARDTAEFLAGFMHISKWKAGRWIDAAHALEGLPLTSAALESGALSIDKTVELTRFATPETEKKLLQWARRVTVGGIRKRADKETKRALKDENEVRSARSLEFTWYEDRLEFAGLLPPDQGAALVRAVDDLAHELPDDAEVTGPTDRATMDQRRADALLLLASRGDEGSSQAPTFVVHTELATLAGDDGGCAVAGGQVLHPETARRLSCDARLQIVLENKKGQTIGVGRESRNPPEYLRRQVFHRDGYTCTFSGCEMRRFLHPHHIQHWTREGPTDLDNLITVCTFHHTLLHEGRWSVILENGRPIWFRPGGRVHEPGPDLPAHPPPRTKEPPNLAIAAGYSRLFDFINMMDPAWRPSPAASRRRAERIRARRLPEWARGELEALHSS